MPERVPLDRQSEPRWRLIPGDCVEVMATLPEASVDSIVCDPPYGLGFMGKEWDGPASFVERKAAKRNTFDHVGGNHNPSNSADQARTRLREGRIYQEWCEAWAKEALRVLKPGGYILACGGTRTYHRLATGIEDAGFEVRDCLAWLYGSGFPKSLDVSKAIDKSKRRDYVQAALTLGIPLPGRSVEDWTREDHAPGDKWWESFKAGLPAAEWQRIEREVVGTKAAVPGVAFTTEGPRELAITAPATPDAEQWQGWGTALKPAHEPICVARKPLVGTVAANVLAHGTGALNVDGCRIEGAPRTTHADGNHQGSAPHPMDWGERNGYVDPGAAGRWPANVLLDPEAAAMLDEQTGELAAGNHPAHRQGIGFTAASGGTNSGTEGERRGTEPGGGSRFFYVAKPDQAERNVGLHGQRNPHPTVKPMDLMRWLCRLVTPPGGTVLDPFTGSGTTGIAALREGFSFIGIERDAEYVEVARARIVGDAPLINSVLEEAA